MFFAGEIARKEAVCKPVFENAVASFVDQGYLVRKDGKLALSESFRSQETVAAIEGRIAGYLGESG